MVLKFYNTLTNKKETFRSLDKGKVKMYNCGPTVYDYAHIGNFRSYLFADLLRRYLEWKGFEVKQIMNITDVGHMTADDSLEVSGEDKVEAAARKTGKNPKQIADFFTMAFFEDIQKLNLRKAYFYPRATDHIGEMQDIIQDLLEKGLAYKRGGSIYFEVKRFPSYGELSGNTLEKLKAGKRVEVREEKRSPFDFALWIRNPKHLMQWQSPWGAGYPGWHVECSAMAFAYLGKQIDIHTGGEDNIFPHHECEIAQSEGHTGKRFSRYWLHTRHLVINGEKMSKSKGNFFTLRDLLGKGYSSREVRFLLIAAHYRTKMNFTESGLKKVRETLKNLENFLTNLKAARGKESKKIAGLLKAARKDFIKAMDDDLGISKALSHLFDLARDVNSLMDKGQVSDKRAKQVLDFFLNIDSVLGLELGSGAEWKTADQAEDAVKNLILERELLRQKREFAQADRIRERLKKMRIVLEDGKKGPRWKSA